MSSLTPAQARDALLSRRNLTTDEVVMIKKLYGRCVDERKADPETYTKCPRCYGLHSVRGNFDDLCDGCVKTILEHFPNHASVPHIKAAFAKWTVQT